MNNDQNPKDSPTEDANTIEQDNGKDARNKLFLLLIGLAVLVIAGIVVVPLFVTQDNIYADIDDSHLVYEPRDIPDEENAHVVLERLRDKELQMPAQDVVPEELRGKGGADVVEEFLKGETASDAHASFVEAYYAENSELFGILEEAREHPAYQHPLGGPNLVLLPLRLIRDLSNLEIAQATLEARSGDPEQATERLFAVLEITQKLSTEPAPLIQMYVTRVISVNTIEAMQAVVETNEFSQSQRDQYAERLDEHTRSASDVANGLRFEYTSQRETIKHFVNEDFERIGAPEELVRELRGNINDTSFDSQQVHRWLFEDYNTMYQNTERECGSPLEDIEIQEFRKDGEAPQNVLERGGENYIGKFLYAASAASFNGAIKRSCERDEKIAELQELLRSDVSVISGSAKSCQVDSDCVLFQPDCEDCTFEAVNEAGLSKLKTEKGEKCSANPPEFQCDSEFTGEIKCIDATCELVSPRDGE